MEWYLVVILILSVTSISGLFFSVQMASMIIDLSTENAKLKIDLRHK